jgi:hypothetical protein
MADLVNARQCRSTHAVWGFIYMSFIRKLVESNKVKDGPVTNLQRNQHFAPWHRAEDDIIYTRLKRSLHA